MSKVKKLTPAELDLYTKLGNNVDAFDNHADAAMGTPQGGFVLGRGANNPSYDAQFDLTVDALYFTVSGGSYTAIAASALNAGLKNNLPVFLFGNADFEGSAYKKLRSQFALNSNWTPVRPFIYGKEDSPITPAVDATVTGQLEDGDMVIPYTSSLPGSGTTTLALIRIRCNSTAYGTLLKSLSSDRFVINGVRFNVASGQEAQFQRAIGIYDLSLFGKFKSDEISPASFKSPQDFQANIVDIPFADGIDKHKALAYNNLWSNESSLLSIFVSGVAKLSA